jgi:GDP/UDP-N,N'-diacetylbacillosamine 2-epimerase (hydrolysing)
MAGSSRKVCFVTGTRAEFGLMVTTLRAMKADPALQLQIVATGMHLDRSHGDGVESIRQQGWQIDAIIPWPNASGNRLTEYAAHTGMAMAQLANAFEELASDVVLVVGDRVEAFAAAGAAHLSGRILAHVHGGDRAAGQADDCLRHAISKLAHLHFPATRQSADRLIKMGEDRWRIRRCGSPGVDGIAVAAALWKEIAEAFPGLVRRRYALVVQHPVDADEAMEARRMRQMLAAVKTSRVDRIVIIHPNNDPGSRGISGVLDEISGDPRLLVRRDVPRRLFLGLMRDTAVMVGNSSSGIIEAGSFGTPVVDVGPRQMGRERGANVLHAEYGRRNVANALEQLWDGSAFVRPRAANVYGGGNAGAKIATVLARVRINAKLRRKLIAY